MLFVTVQVTVSPKLISRRFEAAVRDLTFGHDLLDVELKIVVRRDTVAAVKAGCSTGCCTLVEI